MMTSVRSLYSNPVRSKKGWVQDELREGILKGKLRPGDKLIIDDIATRMKVSQVPVREALQKLEAEGFVIWPLHASATVAEIQPNLIDEIFGLLSASETISASAACKIIGTNDLEALRTHIVKMDTQIEDLDEWSASNMKLHQYICDCAGMMLVKNTLTRALDHWNRLRQCYLNEVFAKRVALAQKEHWELFDAIAERDVTRIENVVRYHNLAARDAYTAQFSIAFQNA
jgi:DNA-binding GntR family transcriptional regulator